ncbi:hypothetical protein LOTGIDRAFT_229413, partial [Lottia gigantea]
MAYICRQLQRIIPKSSKHGAATCSFRLYSTSYENDEDRKKGRFSIAKHIINFSFLNFISSLEPFDSYVHRRQRKNFKEQEGFDHMRYAVLGSDLATAQFVIARGGAVKFVDDETWHDNQTGMVPNHKVEGLNLEAVDISQTQLSSVALDNFIELDHLRYLNASDCEYVDDWFLAKLYLLENTLEFLDVSGCHNVSERGLLSLHHLKKLQGLRLDNMEHIKELELTVVLLQEYFPNLVVLGLDKDTPKSIDS